MCFFIPNQKTGIIVHIAGSYRPFMTFSFLSFWSLTMVTINWHCMEIEAWIFCKMLCFHMKKKKKIT